MDVERVRRDFPLYTGASKDYIYLDNACQTLRPTSVIEAMARYYLEYPACGGRSVHRLATQVSIEVEEAQLEWASMLSLSKHLARNKVIMEVHIENLEATSDTFSPNLSTSSMLL